MSQTTTLAVIGGAAALASAVLGLVHHDATPAQAAPRPTAPVVLHLEHPLHVPSAPEQGVLGPDGVTGSGDVLGPWNVVPPTPAPPVLAPHAVIRPL